MMSWRRAAAAAAGALAGLSVLLTAGPANANDKLVSLVIADTAQSAPTYRIDVRNSTVAPVDVTLRQGIPPGASVATVSSGGSTGETEITWQLRLPASGMATVNASFRPSGGTPQAFPACVYEKDSDRPYDCATTTWTPSTGIEAASGAWWQRPSPFLLGGLAALVAVLMLGYRRRYRRQERRTAHRRAVVGPAGRRIRLPRTADPPPRRRWRPSTPMVSGFLALLLFGLGVTGIRITTYGAEVLDGANRVPSGWIGTPNTGGVGTLLHETAFEFAVYRLACAPSGPDLRRCVATVGLHNHSDAEQLWYGPLQRAYLPTGDWIGVDEAATREANGGRDLFAEPVPADTRLLVPLAFTVASELLPSRLELRSGAFSAGVTVTCV